MTRRIEPVADPADGDEVDGPRGITLNLGAQPSDVDVHSSSAALVCMTPDPIDELVATEDAARLARQQGQEGEFLRPEMDVPTTSLNSAPDEIESDLVSDQQRLDGLVLETCAPFEQQMSATSKLDRISRCGKGLVEPHGQGLETPGDVSQLIEEHQAQTGSHAPFGSRGEQVRRLGRRKGQDGEARFRLPQASDKERSDRHGLDADRRATERRLVHAREHEPAARRLRIFRRGRGCLHAGLDLGLPDGRCGMVRPVFPADLSENKLAAGHTGPGMRICRRRSELGVGHWRRSVFNVFGLFAGRQRAGPLPGYAPAEFMEMRHQVCRSVRMHRDIHI